MPGQGNEALVVYAARIDKKTNDLAAELAGNAAALANATTVDEVNSILEPTVKGLEAIGKQPEAPPDEPPAEPARRR